jgi:hypothetical protein
MDEIQLAKQLKQENLTEDKNIIMNKCFEVQRALNI